MSDPKPSPNYDYTSAARSAKANARAAMVLPSIRLDAEHAEALVSIMLPGETRTEAIRRLIRSAAQRP